MNKKTGKVSSSNGFSLIEMISVIAVVAIMASLTLPAIQSFSDTTGRRGAVTTLMSTLEQARVAALESGRNVYVVFCRQATPNADKLLVLREPENATENYEQLTRWINLPKGLILFDPGSGPSTILDAGIGSLDRALSPIALPADSSLPTSKGLAVVKFNGSGQVAYPTTGKLWLHLSEGVRDSSGNEARTARKVAGNLPFEIITIAKYTGRAQLDVTDLAAN